MMKIFRSEVVDGKKRSTFIYHKNWFIIRNFKGIYYLEIHERDISPGGKLLLSISLNTHLTLAEEFAIHITYGFIYGKYGEWLSER